MHIAPAAMTVSLTAQVLSDQGISLVHAVQASRSSRGQQEHDGGLKVGCMRLLMSMSAPTDKPAACSASGLKLRPRQVYMFSPHLWTRESSLDCSSMSLPLCASLQRDRGCGTRHCERPCQAPPHGAPLHELGRAQSRHSVTQQQLPHAFERCLLAHHGCVPVNAPLHMTSRMNQ